MVKTVERVHRSTDKFPPEVQATIRSMLSGRWPSGVERVGFPTYADIVEHCGAAGCPVSVSAIARLAKRLRRDGGGLPIIPDTKNRLKLVVRNAITALQFLDAEISN